MNSSTRMSPTPLNVHRIAFCGGIYSNYLALEALLEDATARGIQHLYCLGDLGAFGWMRTLPPEIRIQVGPYRVLLCHGSPRKMNEFLWESTTSDAFLNWLFKKYETDIIVGTHTGLHWHREPSPGKHYINCGAIGRPSNDGQTTVVYVILSIETAESLTPDPKTNFMSHDDNDCRLKVDFLRLAYDHERLACEMAFEGLPGEFIETIRTGWWTTCNEVLPAKERARGIY